ncbi:polyprenyl synthetase family protein [candidate division WOR-3 bacterium]|nr:polyprenyl synthetase family protein [candidate division WOR-3 bacterium]
MHRIDELKQRVDRCLVRFLEEKKGRRKDSYNETLFDLLSDFATRGGKRIRPILMIETYLSCGGKDEGGIIEASISIELLEDYLLIHDDIIDRDDLRRGGATLDRMAEEAMGAGRQSPSHFGLSCALLGGDMLASLALLPILESGFPSKMKIKALQRFVYACMDCFKGELLDVVMEGCQNIDEDGLINMIDLKTGSYTTSLPVVLGGIFAGVLDISGLMEYGKLIGRAFQIRDDILGTFGDNKETGKPISSDIKQGKATLLTLYVLKNGTKKEKGLLKSKMGKDIGEEDTEMIRKIMRESGALDYSMRKIEYYAELAQKLLPRLPFKSTDFFYWFTDYLKSRRF